MPLFFKAPTDATQRGLPVKLPANLGRIVLAIVLAVALAVGAQLTKTAFPELSASLWTGFELCLAAILGFFGIEAMKYA